ncbi:hypothetical protein HYH03_005818 [Edaphochlamys debaryana]|uniref:Uncharacterized protein n=1 Tax=Edaphochlamys debaryana TaxID=47281 RepID=A0A835YC96_9CHLO|nr:hypothetical protein HYH03_005818 [Edaphochlamys debaryana]|eukprot:KAG2496220.1 hypothetical protein HYH03_005818 [Edaphochlamys debaryana]
MAASSSGPESGNDRPSLGGALLLIGAPGSGKSKLGRELAQTRLGGWVRLLDVREELGARGLEGTSAARSLAEHRRAVAKELLQQAADEWTALQQARPTSSPLLLLECVEDTEDTFAVVEALREAGVPLLQVLYLTHPAPHWRKGQRMAERTAQWTAAQTCRVLEFFSALGVLTEVDEGMGYSISEPPGPGRLAAAGYAAGPFFSTRRPSAGHTATKTQRRAHPTPPSSAPPPAWLASVPGLRLPQCLSLTPLQPVTSTRLVTSRRERDRVLAAAAGASGLRLDSFFGGGGGGGGGGGSVGPALPMPARTVASAAEARWVGWPGRYAVSRKADGTRHLLMVLGGEEGEGAGGSSSAGGSIGGSGAEAYLLNRAGALYRFPIRTSEVVAHSSVPPSAAAGCGGGGGLPSGTLLDGELMWVGGRGFFLAFDALCVGGRRLWSRPLRERLAAMGEGGSGGGVGGGAGGRALAEAEASEELQAAAAAAATAAAEQPSQLAGPTIFRKTQQAPLPSAGDTVCVLRKGATEVTAAALRQLEASRDACSYPNDGLVFTPYDMPYVLGMAELSYTWQPAEQVAVDLVGSDAHDAAGYSTRLPLNTLITIRFLPEQPAEPAAPNNLNPYFDSRCQQLKVDDPARLLPFEELYGSVMAGVEAGVVERIVDPDCGLEVFSCRTMRAHALPVAALCRGLVLHPPSRSVVAAPLAPYGQPSDLPVRSLPSGWLGTAQCGTRLRTAQCDKFRQVNLPQQTATLLPETLEAEEPMAHGRPQPRLAVGPSGVSSSSSPQRQASASVKVDGSLVLAFTWAGQLRTATLGGMDTQQALWAGVWLRSHARLSAFLPGWTYVLEAVCGMNTRVVSYGFEGAVLLGAYDAEGREAARDQLPALAKALGVTMAVPSVEGPLPELLAGLPGASTPALHGSTEGSTPQQPPAFEGWVVATADGRRYKLVPLPYRQEGYSRARDELLRLLRAAEMEGRLSELQRLAEAAAPAGGGAGAVSAATQLQVLLSQLRLQDWGGSVSTSAGGAVVPAGSGGGGTAEAAPAAAGAALPTAMLCALSYATKALRTGDAVSRNAGLPSSPYYRHVSRENSYTSESTRGGAPLVRGLLLRCIQPGVDGSLPGYSPSPAFANSWAEGWARGPVGRMDPSAPPPLLHAALPDRRGAAGALP